MEGTHQEHLEYFLSLFYRMEKRLEKYDDESFPGEHDMKYRELQYSYVLIRSFLNFLEGMDKDDSEKIEDALLVMGELTSRFDYFDRYGKDFGTDD